MKLKPGIYQHYKGKFYWVIGIARHSETAEELVAYVPLYLTDTGHTMAVRPKTMFMEKVELKGQTVPRFVYIK